MKLSLKRLVLLILFVAFQVSGCYNDMDLNDKDIIEIPQENKVELEKVWELEAEGKLFMEDIQGNTLYGITNKHIIYIIDIDTGKLIKSFKADIREGYTSDGISVYEDIIAVSFPHEFYVLDMKTEKVLFHKKVGPSGTGKIFDMHLYKDLVIYSDMPHNTIYAINYKTGNTAWELGEEQANQGHYRLEKYKDRYFFDSPSLDSYYEYNPLTGEILMRYKFVFGEEIANEDQDSFMPIFGHIEDKEFENWLKSKQSDVFNLTDKGYIYSVAWNRFHFHGTDKDLDWTLKLPKEILLTEDYGRYTFLNQKNSISLLDLEQKEILWNEDFNNDDYINAFIFESKLFISSRDGRIIAYDLSKLEP